MNSLNLATVKQCIWDVQNRIRRAVRQALRDTPEWDDSKRLSEADELRLHSVISSLVGAMQLADRDLAGLDFLAAIHSSEKSVEEEVSEEEEGRVAA